MSRIISSVLAVILVLSLTIPVLAEVPDNTPFDVKADSALLIDRAATYGRIALREKTPNKPCRPHL